MAQKDFGQVQRRGATFKRLLVLKQLSAIAIGGLSIYRTLKEALLFVDAQVSLEGPTELLPFGCFGSRFPLGHSLDQVVGGNSNTPNGIRIRVGGVKGRCPRPLDDGGTQHLQYIKVTAIRQIDLKPDKSPSLLIQ